MHLYYAANGERVQRLSNQMGISNNQLRDLNFVAGSMFYATKAALMPIVELNLNENDFEPEAGQTDGTMAHVVERLFAAALLKTDLCIADTGFDFEKPVLTISKVNHFIV
jgi:lipopolysaccharide biosynthesis protein